MRELVHRPRAAQENFLSGARIAADGRRDLEVTPPRHRPSHDRLTGFRGDVRQAALEIVEFANSQLLEFRYYDERLDNELSSIYARLQQPRWLDQWLGSRYTRAADIETKLKTLDDIYRFAVEQSGMSRGQFLELTIVLILIFELVLFFMGIMQ